MRIPQITLQPTAVHKSKALLGSQRLLIAGILIGIGLRLALAWGTQGNFDQDSYAIVADIMRRGGNVYAETRRYNYSPLWSYCLLLCAGIVDVTHLPLAAVVRTFLISADLIDAFLIGIISVQLGARHPLPAAAIYLLNPVSILIVGYHGQFENFAMMPVLLLVWLALRQIGPSMVTIFLLGALALLIKHDTLFVVWMLLVYLTPNRLQAELMLMGILSLFALSFVPYLRDGFNGIFVHVIAYSSLQKLYGLGMLLPGYLNRPIFFLAMVVLPFIARYRMRLPLAQAVMLSVVAMLALIYGIGEQYFILPVIVGSVRRSHFYWIYTAAAAIFLIGSPSNLAITFVPSLWNTVWLAAMAWGLSFFLEWKAPLLALQEHPHSESAL